MNHSQDPQKKNEEKKEENNDSLETEEDKIKKLEELQQKFDEVQNEEDLKKLLDELMKTKTGKKANVLIEGISFQIFEHNILNYLVSLLLDFLIYFALLGFFNSLTIEPFYLHFPFIFLFSTISYFVKNYLYNHHPLLVIKSLETIPALSEAIIFGVLLTCGILFLKFKVTSIGLFILSIVLFLIVRTVLVYYLRNLVLKLKLK